MITAMLLGTLGAANAEQPTSVASETIDDREGGGVRSAVADVAEMDRRRPLHDGGRIGGREEAEQRDCEGGGM